jgi:hypothetical protein
VVTNDLKAVQVAGLYKADPPRESYKVSLLNISPKNIVAIYFFTPNISGKGGSSQFNTGSVDRPLIKSGEVYTEDIGAGRNVGYPPPGSVTGAPRAQWISVRTVIFDDGTYEGDADQAAGLEARGAGLRSQRIRIIELLKQSVSKGPTEPVVSLDTLKENVYALGTDPESVQVEEVISKYPALTVDGKESVRFWVKSGMGSGKHEIVGSIERFEELMKASPEKADVAKWLKETIARFEAEVATK